MNERDSLSNEVRLEGRITETGLTIKTKSRAIAAVDRLMGSVMDVPAAKLEACASRIRAQGRLETHLIDHFSAEIETIIGSTESTAKLVNGLLAPKIQALANKQYVVQRAIDHLISPDSESKPESESGPDEVDPDWLNYFDGYAKKASSDAVRDLWARVLAGEIRHPKSFSLMTLRVLAELDQQMASWFQEAVEFRFSGKYILPPENFRGSQLVRLNFLQEVGLLHHIEPVGGIAYIFKPDPDGFAALFEGHLCLRIRLGNEVKLSVIGLTRVGKELASILPPVDPISVFRKVAAALPGEIQSADICRILAEDQEHVRLSDPIEILRSEGPAE